MNYFTPSFLLLQKRMTSTEYNIALVGASASGKTAFMRFLKNIPLETIKNNRYHPTSHTQVHPISHRGYLFNIWEAGKFSTIDTFPNIRVAILITKETNPVMPILPGNPPIVVVNNRKYIMTEADVYRALDKVVDIIQQ